MESNGAIKWLLLTSELELCISISGIKTLLEIEISPGIPDS